MTQLTLHVTLVSIVLCLTINTVNGQSFQLFSDNPDILRNTTQILQSRGFNFELHHPITKDGYILTLVRLINPFIQNRTNLRPIYIQHGLFGSADDFLLSRKGRLVNGQYIQMPELMTTNCTGDDQMNVAQPLPLVLAACGYDVWMGNYRGNRYSNKHIVLNPGKGILTGLVAAELGYIGHSLGTSGMFQLLSARPQYSQYIRPYIALAPVTHVFNIKALLLQIAAHTAPYIQLLGDLNAPFFGITSDRLAIVDQLIATFICGNSLIRPLCTLFLFSLCGFDQPNTDDNIVTVAFGHFPDGTSTRTLAHLAQRVVKNTFSFYDYGITKNIELYNSEIAPVYNLSRIDNKYMIFMSGINDYLADPTDVDILRSQLTVRPYVDYAIPFPLFNHVDFLFGNNVGRYQNSLVLRLLRQLYDQS